MNYLWIPSPELSIARIRGRVRDGGHHVPDTVVRRRYAAGLRNFLELYQPLADFWRMYDNQDPNNRLRPVAQGSESEVRTVYDEVTWSRIEAEAQK